MYSLIELVGNEREVKSVKVFSNIVNAEKAGIARLYQLTKTVINFGQIEEDWDLVKFLESNMFEDAAALFSLVYTGPHDQVIYLEIHKSDVQFDS